MFLKLGSSWHPYLPPNGYDTCAICSCDANTLEIKCPRIQCPPLTCSEKVAFRPDKKACCKRCPDVSFNTNLFVIINWNQLISQVKPKVVKNSGDPDNQLDDPSKLPSTVTLPGSCKSHMGWHKNGDEWHPIIASIGEQKCIKCRCKVSNTRILDILIVLCNVSDLVSCQSKKKYPLNWGGKKPHI